MWQTIKGGEACPIDLELYNATVQDLETKGAQLRERKDIRGFFKTNVVRVVSETKEALKEDTEHVEVEDVENEAEDDEEVTKQRTKPAQVKLEDDMRKTKLAIENLKTAKVLAVDLESTHSELAKSHIRFPPLAARQILEESLTPEALKTLYGKSVPYDAFLPSCQGKIEARTCKVCYKYHATKKSLQCHKKICKRSKSRAGVQKKRKHVYEAVEDEFFSVEDEEEVESEDDEEEVEEALEVVRLRPKYSVASGGGLETILHLKEWLKSPWQE